MPDFLCLKHDFSQSPAAYPGLSTEPRIEDLVMAAGLESQVLASKQWAFGFCRELGLS